MELTTNVRTNCLYIRSNVCFSFNNLWFINFVQYFLRKLSYKNLSTHTSTPFSLLTLHHYINQNLQKRFINFPTIHFHSLTCHVLSFQSRAIYCNPIKSQDLAQIIWINLLRIEKNTHTHTRTQTNKPTNNFGQLSNEILFVVCSNKKHT